MDAGTRVWGALLQTRRDQQPAAGAAGRPALRMPRWHSTARRAHARAHATLGTHLLRAAGLGLLWCGSHGAVTLSGRGGGGEQVGIAVQAPLQRGERKDPVVRSASAAQCNCHAEPCHPMYMPPRLPRAAPPRRLPGQLDLACLPCPGSTARCCRESRWRSWRRAWGTSAGPGRHTSCSCLVVIGAAAVVGQAVYRQLPAAGRPLAGGHSNSKPARRTTPFKSSRQGTSEGSRRRKSRPLPSFRSSRPATQCVRGGSALHCSVSCRALVPGAAAGTEARLVSLVGLPWAPRVCRRVQHSRRSMAWHGAAQRGMAWQAALLALLSCLHRVWADGAAGGAQDGLLW